MYFGILKSSQNQQLQERLLDFNLAKRGLRGKKWATIMFFFVATKLTKGIPFLGMWSLCQRD